MDITEYVKRNNFAVAQYELKSRRTAQNPLLSGETRCSRRRGEERDTPFQSLHRRPGPESVQAESPQSHLSANRELLRWAVSAKHIATSPGSFGKEAIAAQVCTTRRVITYIHIRNIFGGQRD